MADSREEAQRWEDFHLELSSRVLFTPSIVLYFTHLANNKLYKDLHDAAKELSQVFVYGKYYFLDLEVEGTPPAPIATPSTYSASQVISSAKDSGPSGRLPVSRADSLSKIVSASEKFNDSVFSLSSLIIGARTPFVYPTDCYYAIGRRASLQASSSSELTNLAWAIKYRAATLRRTASVKGQGATFKVDSTQVTCFIEGDPTSPKLLGIEVGDLVNNSDVVVTSITDTYFEVSAQVSDITSITNSLGSVELVSSILRGHLLSFNPIAVPDSVNSASDFKSLLQSMLNSLRDLSEDLTPDSTIINQLGLSVESRKNLLPQVEEIPSKFTKSQRDFAIKTLDLAKSKGFDMIEFMLRNYRISEALALATTQRSLHDIAVTAGEAMELFVSNTKRGI